MTEFPVSPVAELPSTVDSLSPVPVPAVSRPPEVAAVPSCGARPQTDQESERLRNLLAGLQDNVVALPVAADDENKEMRFENHLAMVRLGMATSLFYAMRTKHAPTAAHCLRVALACSAWSARLGLTEEDRDRMEVAALLHDLGKIGIPDRILRKPGKLSVDEQLAMATCPEIACEILRGCTGDNELLNIIRYTDTWFDSRRQEESLRGDALPLGSRMLAIASAFDAMTTDQVYRPALSRERAIQELIGGSGTQFDPELALDYGVMLEQRPELLQGAVVDRWLQQLRLDPNRALPGSDESVLIQRVRSNGGSPRDRRNQLFYDRLTDHMLDGVVFTDAEGTVDRWNHAMTRITGIAADAIIGQTWKNESLRLRERNNDRGDCPIQACLQNAAPLARNMQIERPGKVPLPVHVQVSPVVGEVPGTHGLVIIVRDLSDKMDMEKQLETLAERVTRDALTGIANRAEFDRRLAESTDLSQRGDATFSLVICDIDHFKQVNDTYGHPAADEALIQFARLLESHSREGDLVARYGGEEFLLLAVNCDNATATRRAEGIRQTLEVTPLESLGNEAITASFGVTEFQSGDNAKTILARADRALLQAKANGRNRVIQLGSGRSVDATELTEKKSGWLSWFESSPKNAPNSVSIVTSVPLELAVEKLRGFIADHEADILKVSANQLNLQVTAVCSTGGRRALDQHIALNVMLTLSESVSGNGSAHQQHRLRKTKVHARIEPVRNRDRRRGELKVCVEQVVSSLNSYLMGQVEPADA